MKKNFHLIFFYWLPVFVWMGLIFYSSSGPALVKIGIRHFDKVIHIGVYGVLGYGVARALARSTDKSKKWIFITSAIFALLYGITDEIHQIFTGRSCEVADMVADLVGGLLAAWVWTLLIGKMPLWFTGRVSAHCNLTCKEK